MPDLNMNPTPDAPVETFPAETQETETQETETQETETQETIEVTAQPTSAPPDTDVLSWMLPGGIGAGIGIAATLGATAITMFIKSKMKKKQSPLPIDMPGSSRFSLPPESWPGIEKLHGQGRRSSQQDSFSVSPDELEATHGRLIIVADGMGGLSDGDKISQAAVSAAMSAFYQAQGTPTDILVDLLAQANLAVNRLLGPEGYCKGGSTMVMGLLKDGVFHWLSVGDSRIVLVRGGAVYQLNHEHVYANELYVQAVNAGTPAAAVTHGQNTAGLTSFLGMGQLKYVDIPPAGIQVREFDRFVLMSDGVYNALSSDELLEGITRGAEALGAAIDGKGYANQDNYTAVILKI